MKNKQIIYIILTIIWMSIIFILSNKSSVASSHSSQGLTYDIVSIYEKIFNKNIDKDYIVTKIENPIRKTAHYFLYFVLGFLVYKSISYSSLKNKCLCASLICLIYSISDEIHQIFIPGRSGEVRDVLIDFSGSITIILIIFIINGMKKKKMI